MASVGITTVNDVMRNWPIPKHFLDQAVQSVRLLVIAASEGSYVAQTFVFNTESGASLSTLIVVANPIESPSDPNSSIAVRYVVINTNANIKQQYNQYYVKQCHKCVKCAWLSRCCCHQQLNFAPRGNTPEELNIIKQRLTAHQYAWFNVQTFDTSFKLAMLNGIATSNSSNASLIESIDKYLSNNNVKTEILKKYNDTILTQLQSNFASLKLSTQKFRFTKVSKANIRVLLSAVAKDYGFDDIFSNQEYSQELEKPKFSYENLLTTPTDNETNNKTIKYIWLIGENMNNMSYTINFLHLNINSHILLFNNTNTSEITNSSEQLKIIRTSSLTSSGEFTDERLMTMMAPWIVQKTRIILNILRFISASTLAPKEHRLISHFQSDLNTSNFNRNGAPNGSSTTSSLSNKISTLTQAISSIASTFQSIINVFKSSSSTTINRIIQTGFTSFQQKTRVLKIINMPADRATEFVNAVSMDYNLPSEGSFMLGLTYSDDFSWEYVEYVYSPSMDGTYRSLILLKNGDILTNTASFFIIDINAEFAIAPDLLIIEKRKSILGGLFESTKQRIEQVPHVLTFEEAEKIKNFFMVVGMSNMATLLGIKVPQPQLK